tara:strand:+ start:110 stop:385 length:276 start_codon:yes stop_codon:yes gene_type:complete
VVVVKVQSAVLSVGVNIASVASIPPLEADVTVIFDPSHVFMAAPYFSVTMVLVMVWVVFSVRFDDPVDHVGVTSEYAGDANKKNNKINFFI